MDLLLAEKGDMSSILDGCHSVPADGFLSHPSCCHSRCNDVLPLCLRCLAFKAEPFILLLRLISLFLEARIRFQRVGRIASAFYKAGIAPLCFMVNDIKLLLVESLLLLLLPVESISSGACFRWP